jgi:hypothetical protein
MSTPNSKQNIMYSWKDKLKNGYLVIFGSGVLFSFFVMVTLKWNNITFTKTSSIHYYPSELSIKNDYDIYKNVYNDGRFQHKSKQNNQDNNIER